MTPQAEYTIAFIGGRLAKRDFRPGLVKFMEKNVPVEKSFTGTITETTIDLYEPGVSQIKGIGEASTYPQIASTGYMGDFSIRVDSSNTFSGVIDGESFQGYISGSVVKLDRSTIEYTLG